MTMISTVNFKGLCLSLKEQLCEIKNLVVFTFPKVIIVTFENW